MRKIFIDCGANDGCSIERFKREKPDANQYEMYSFEADPIFNQCFPIEGVHYHNKAVWVKDEKITFFRVKQNKNGSYEPNEAGTIIEAKKRWNIKAGHKKFKDIEVEAIDFDSWIKNNFSVQDYIILKLDIEGAEYEVLNHMIKNGSIRYINVLLYEFHNYKCGKTIQDDRILIRKLHKAGIRCRSWDAGYYK